MLSALCACVAKDGENPAEPSVEIPPSWDDQGDSDWIYRNQFKGHMRHLWLDCNRVVSAGRGDMRPTYVEIRASAADIRERAELMGGYWDKLAAQAEEMQWILEDEDRIGATQTLKAIGAACDGCHMASWSPAYLHITTNTLQAWLDNRPTPHGEDENDANPPPTNPNRKSMQLLWRDYQSLENGIEAWDIVLAQESIEMLLPEFKARADAWTRVAELAGKIEQSAADEDADALSQPYSELRSQCITCHARLVEDERAVLNPMSWDGPSE
jgi:hypothetical protein